MISTLVSIAVNIKSELHSDIGRVLFVGGLDVDESVTGDGEVRPVYLARLGSDELLRLAVVGPSSASAKLFRPNFSFWQGACGEEGDSSLIDKVVSKMLGKSQTSVI